MGKANKEKEKEWSKAPDDPGWLTVSKQQLAS
jgi:hypothetical protein